MEAREMKGLEIARTSRIRKTHRGWIVPSQSGRGTYIVRFNGHEPTCTCQDCQLHRVKCKHIFAVEFWMKEEIDKEGKITTTKGMRITYAQDWSAYNKAQIQEGDLFMKLLADLCGNVRQPAYKFGRPTLPMADMVFASALKVYTTFSLRRFISNMRTANEKGYIDNVCSYSTVSNYMRKPEMTELLQELVRVSSLPLASVEQTFGVDSSGFSTCRFERWFSFKHGKQLSKRAWIKEHLNCGTRTNVVTSARVSDGNANDSPYFRGLVEETAQSFEINEVSADKAYCSRDNLKAVQETGGQAFIPFKSNAASNASKGRLWNRAYHYFMYNHEEFLQHYHRRSNSETVFHMIKSKFGDSLRSKDKTAQMNETLLKVLCHNICVVIQEMHELGVAPQFLCL
jgi:transposase